MPIDKTPLVGNYSYYDINMYAQPYWIVEIEGKRLVGCHYSLPERVEIRQTVHCAGKITSVVRKMKYIM